MACGWALHGGIWRHERPTNGHDFTPLGCRLTPITPLCSYLAYHLTPVQELSAPETSNYIVLDHPFTVSYHVYNVGNGVAKNVVLHDDWPTDTFTPLTNVTANAEWAELPPYVSHCTCGAP